MAFITYYLTMAPTASFWDCGEFIACANELEVPHPPGAPFFLILGRFFAMFAQSPQTVAWWINMTSVLSSAFAVLFTFWITTHLAKKLITAGKEKLELSDNLVIMAAGLVAALTVTFSDSFWFNAVEAEVYAMSSFFTAAVVWLIFKWEARADEPGSPQVDHPDRLCDGRVDRYALAEPLGDPDAGICVLLPQVQNHIAGHRRHLHDVGLHLGTDPIWPHPKGCGACMVL